MKNNYQVAIIGGGPGGYVAAIRLNQLGIDTILFEEEKLGGVCLNYGCIPTKTLVANANLFGTMKNSEKFGISCVNPELDWEKVQTRKANVIANLIKGLEHIFSKRGIEICYKKVHKIIPGTQYHKLYYGKRNESYIEAKFIIIATGSLPNSLSNLNFDHKYILTSKDLLAIKEIPQNLAIIGGGVIGCEFASIFKSFGSEVEIIEFMPNLIPTEDEEISKKLAFEMKKKRIKIHLNTTVENWEIKDGKVVLSLSNNKKFDVDKVLLSVGRTPKFDIQVEGNEKIFDTIITVNQNFQTKIRNIFAIGDVIAKQMLAHTASKQAVLVASHIKNLIENDVVDIPKLNYTNIPRCIFTEPEIGCVGLSESEARKKCNSISIGKFMFRASGKALAIGKENGLVKAILDDSSKKLLGLHIIGHCAAELVAQAAILINSKISFKEVEKIVFAHPTLSETIHEAILDTQGLAIHKI